MTFPSDEVLLAFERCHGMATGAMLSAAGLSRRGRADAVADGLFEVHYERVYRIVSSPLTFEARCAAVCLAYPRGFLTGPTGGTLTLLRRMPRAPHLIYCMPHGSHIGPFDDVVVRQSTKMPPSHIVRRADGIRVASPARLAFDLAADLSALDHRSMVEQLLDMGKVTMGTLARMGKEMIHPARAGSQRYLATLLSRSGRPADSHPEVLVADGLRRRGVPVETQVDPLQLGRGRRLALDMAVPAVRWGVEIDVHPDHLLLDGTTRDKRRDRSCHRVDWQVEHVTELDLIDLEALCDELEELYRLRAQVVARRAA